ncbi:MAG: glycosyltransferase family 4 protein [Candidatus Syntrophonatronum acetioxidans]|uniref:Glycosyltransferase family 4 protein n=1 Tax=Candidatus Syntrophonatronum acetioxidans TaxID=1795816 RepID=A0A424YFZ9_9FIRM|nr:MAG: glycosyltransferase family 4 protein [Candidatus Syntrophonatronum acetioxidans]
MKVLLISNMYPSKKYPAYGSFVQETVRGLEELEGMECQVVAISEREAGLKKNLLKYSRLFLDTGKALLFSSYDLVNAHYIFPTGFLALPAALLRGKPLVVTSHGGDVRLGKKNAPLKALTSLVLHKARRVVAVSHYLARELEGEFSLPREKIEVINCGVDTDKFFPRPREKALAELGLNPRPKEEKIILFVGNLIELKGLMPLLRAFASISPSLPQARLVLVGEGPLKERLLQEASSLGIKDRVTFTGPLPHHRIPTWMSAAHLFVLPSYQEGFGLVALEALACATPVVASRVGGLPEVVTHERDGLLVPPGEEKALAEKILLLLKDEKLHGEFSSRARDSALGHDFKRQIKRLGGVFHSLGPSS